LAPTKAISTGDSAIWVHKPTSFDSLVFGKSIHPYLFDVNNNGKLDLLIGSQLRGIKLFKNVGSSTIPHFDTNNLVYNWAGILHSNGIGNGNLSIAIADLDTAGKPIDSITNIKAQRHVFVGTSNGYLFSYSGLDSTGLNDIHQNRDSVYHYTTDLSIAFKDITGDDKPDFILGQKSGGVSVLLKDRGEIVIPPPPNPKSIERPEEESSFNVYPNPTTGKMNVELFNSQSTAYSFQIRDSSGRVLLTGSTIKDEALDLSALPIGVYWLELSVDYKKMYRKVVKVDP
tara:strand:- start:54157 stop:55014 length:858 start_codon:yes stop_codon:yes gene_type:complete